MFSDLVKKVRFKQPLLIWPSILVLLGLIAYPMGSVLLQSIFPKLFDQGFHPFSLQSYITPFQNSYTYHSIANAFIFGFGSAIIAAFLGTFFAILVHRRWIHGQKLINIVIWLVFFTPSYLVAEGWVLMMQDKGVLCELFHLPDGTFSWFFTPAGLVAAMAFRLFPVVYLSVRAALNGIGSDFEDAARTQGAKAARVWIKIVIPLLMPAILAGSTLTFAESASDFGFAAAMVPKAHIPMLTYSIYTALSQMPVNYSEAGALSLLLIIIIAVAIWIQKWILGKGSYSVIQNQIRPSRSRHKPSVLWSITAYGGLLLIFALPMCGEAATSFMMNSSHGFALSNLSFNNYLDILNLRDNSQVFPFLSSLLRSLRLSAYTAVTVTILGIGLAYVITKQTGWSTRILYVLTMSTLAIPGIVLAAGYIFAWNAPYLVPFHLNFYGTLFCLFLAYTAGALPNSIRLQMAALTQINPSLLQAGQIHGAKTWVIFRKIILPLTASTTVSVFFLIFSHAMFELPASQLLVPAGETVLPVVITHYYTEFMIEHGAAITVMGIFTVLVVYGIGQFIIHLWTFGRKKLLLHSIRMDASKDLMLENPGIAYSNSSEREIIS